MEASPNDFLRVNINHSSLDLDIWLEFTQSKNLVWNSAGILRFSLNGGSGVEIEIDRQLSVSSHFSDLLVVNRTHDYSPD
jgi:hypothetical protein